MLPVHLLLWIEMVVVCWPLPLQLWSGWQADQNLEFFLIRYLAICECFLLLALDLMLDRLLKGDYDISIGF